MGDYFSFQTMITGWIVRVLYVIGVILLIIAAVLTLIGTAITPYVPEQMNLSGALQGVIGFFVILIIGNILWRIFCEALILIFSMHDNLVAIRKELAPRAATNAGENA